MRTSLRLDLSPGFYLCMAAILLAVPLKWCMAFLCAAVLHELCHLVAVRICGGHIPVIRIGAGGAMMHAPALSQGKALFCTLAGPAGGFLALLLARWFPRLAICAAIQSAFNLLPLNGLDGGQALRCAVSLLLPPAVTDRICCVIHYFILSIGAALGIYGTFILKLGLLPLFAAVILILRGMAGKFPCK